MVVAHQRQFGAAVQRDAVEQLRLVGRQHGGELARVGSVAVALIERTRHCLLDGHLLQQRGQFLERAAGRQAQAAHVVDDGQHGRPVALRDGLHEVARMAAIHRAEHAAHHGFIQLPGTEGDGLIGERQGVAHRAPRSATEQTQGTGLERHTFRL